MFILFDDEAYLNVKTSGDFEYPAEEIERKESTLGVKIEAIADYMLRNLGTIPHSITIKLGFQKYRFLTFKKYQNDFYLSCITEGNLNKLDKVETQLEPFLFPVINTPFSGNLRPFNKLKAAIKKWVNKVPERKFS